VRLKVVRGRSGDRILPALYEDNYLTLLPGETRHVRTEVDQADTRGESLWIDSRFPWSWSAQVSCDLRGPLEKTVTESISIAAPSALNLAVVVRGMFLNSDFASVPSSG